MDIFELTRALVDIESITNHEEAVGVFLDGVLAKLADRWQGRVERCPVEAGRFNVFAYWGDPVVTLSTHMRMLCLAFLPSRGRRVHLGTRRDRRLRE